MAGHTTFSILVKPPGFFFQGGHSSSEEDLFVDIVDDKTYSEEELCGDDYFNGGDTELFFEDHFIDDKSEDHFSDGKNEDHFINDKSEDHFTNSKSDGYDEFFGSAQRDTPANFDTFFTEQLNYF